MILVSDPGLVWKARSKQYAHHGTLQVEHTNLIIISQQVKNSKGPNSCVISGNGRCLGAQQTAIRRKGLYVLTSRTVNLRMGRHVWPLRGVIRVMIRYALCLYILPWREVIRLMI